MNLAGKMPAPLFLQAAGHECDKTLTESKSIVMNSMRKSMMKSVLVFYVAIGLLCVLSVFSFQATGCSSVVHADSKPGRKLDPAAWGTDHVGKPLPEFVTGDECLFCHRMDVGPTWSKNRHFQTMRRVNSKSKAVALLRKNASTKNLSAEVEFVLGGKRHTRFLKQTEKYGHLALLSTAWTSTQTGNSGKLTGTDTPHWNKQLFGKSCAGCHASGVDAKTESVTAVSLECFTCHGVVQLEHSKDASKAIHSKKRKDPARVVVSICGQCHIRTGKSRSTGRPHANHFVAGDNLFRDFEVDWSVKHLRTLNPADRHVLENIRDVVLLGNSDVTCLSCHNVHKQSSEKHQLLDDQSICMNCHHATGSKAELKPYEVHSRVCEY